MLLTPFFFQTFFTMDDIKHLFSEDQMGQICEVNYETVCYDEDMRGGSALSQEAIQKLEKEQNVCFEGRKAEVTRHVQKSKMDGETVRKE